MLSTIRPGRTKALIQANRRKAHVASIAPGENEWLTACSRKVQTGEGTAFALLHEAVQQADVTDWCLYCAALYATADIFYDRGYAAGYSAAMQEQAR